MGLLAALAVIVLALVVIGGCFWLFGVMIARAFAEAIGRGLNW